MPTAKWSTLQKFLFQFFFIYFIFYAAPWTWLDGIPYYEYVSMGYNWLIDQLVQFGNRYIFKAYKELVPLNGSGDTSWAYTQLWLFLLISLVGAAIWLVLDRNKPHYRNWNYVLSNVVRYFLAINAFGYGIIKLFALQMIFPSLSQLATPLGELLPMRFSWLFIGYSETYQVFSGAAEVVVGLLLFYRRTATGGTLMAFAVFTNVMVMNFAYDIPVKLFSTHLVVMSLFLLAQEHQRIAAFFFFNQTAAPSSLYDRVFHKKWQRIIRIITKIGFVILIIILPFYFSYERKQSMKEIVDQKPIRSGVYDVADFVLNKDTIPAIIGDSARRWSQLIFQPGTTGSMLSADTLYRKMYGRAYFGYFVDTAKQEMQFRWAGKQSDSLFTLKYNIPDSTTIALTGKIRNDSVYIRLKRTNKQFRLAEKQFHWLSEYNR